MFHSAFLEQTGGPSPVGLQITSHNTGKAISTEEFVPESGNEPENNTEKSRTLL
jgi:hypothetical protein